MITWHWHEPTTIELVPQTTTSPTSSTPSLVAPPPSALPLIETGPSDPNMSSNLLSLCDKRVLRRFTRFTTPTGKGRVLGSWDSMTGPNCWAVAMEEGERRWERRRSRYGSAPEEVTKRRSNRYDDDQAINAGEYNGASGSMKCSYDGGMLWCVVRVNPNRLAFQPPFIPIAKP
jgi:hypothetical protein